MKAYTTTEAHSLKAMHPKICPKVFEEFVNNWKTAKAESMMKKQSNKIVGKARVRLY